MVQGLTTFVKRRSKQYMEKYELHDTEVVIDRNAVAYYLFEQLQNPNCSFNGDYDWYANVIRSFFQTLLDCNITPYILFYSSYNKDTETLLNRMQDRINSAVKINPTSTELIYPFNLSETFSDVAKEFNIKMICSDFKCLAKIANTLNCPIISLNAHYYIFDVHYIPVSTMRLRSMTCIKTINNKKQKYKFLHCSAFNRNKFITDIGIGVDVLPLFAVLTQYNIFRKVFKNQYCNSLGRITKVASFLSNQTVESTLEKIQMNSDLSEDGDLVDQIHTSIATYMINQETVSKCLKYLNLERRFLNAGGNIEEDEFNAYVTTTGVSREVVQSLFDNVRKCIYPPYIIAILLYNTYHLRPQVEEVTMECSHLISMDIIAAIYKILKPNADQLQLYTRTGTQHVKYLVPFCTISVPSHSDLQSMNLQSRQQILYNVLNVNINFVNNCLNHFPDSWKLFIIAVTYLSHKSVISRPFIYALLLCKIVIKYVDRKLEKIIRDPKELTETYKEVLFQILVKKQVDSNLKSTIQEAIEDITFDDSILALKNLIHFFPS